MGGRTHIFEGQPDARQMEIITGTTVFRPRYRALEPNEIAIHDDIKTRAAALYDIMNLVPAGWELSLAKTKLEEAVM